MQTSGLKESCRYTSEENKTLPRECRPGHLHPSSATPTHTSPRLYLVLLQFVDLHLEAEAAALNLMLPSSLTHGALLAGENQAQWTPGRAVVLAGRLRLLTRADL
uniref:Uncharacterized protein n=1 Tax=Mus musculus TaxID=10090 RepID=Q3TZK6_MOUSE|nr:unnamed protein product [Mus musculus]